MGTKSSGHLDAQKLQSEDTIHYVSTLAYSGVRDNFLTAKLDPRGCPRTPRNARTAVRVDSNYRCIATSGASCRWGPSLHADLGQDSGSISIQAAEISIVTWTVVPAVLVTVLVSCISVSSRNPKSKRECHCPRIKNDYGDI